MKKEANEVRYEVAKAYANAVLRPAARSGCCGGGADAEIRKGATVTYAGYSDGELSSLPGEAVVNSFGCGNPVAMAGLRPGEGVLDLGSGAGIDLLLAAKRVGPTGRVIGVDMTDVMLAKAKANIAKSGLTNVEVRQGIIEQLPVEDGSVDWVISNCVINLSPEKAKVFQEIARVLKPGGQMLVSDIVATELPTAVLEQAGLYSSCIAGAIDEGAYLDGLRAAGLSEVRVRDRLVYDADQLEAIASSAEGGCGCGGGDADQARLARTLAGKVWSAKIYARKPG